MPKSLEDLENEMRILKSEVQQALLDIREFLLTYVENPFPAGGGRERSASGGVLSSLTQGANGFSAEGKHAETPSSVSGPGGGGSGPVSGGTASVSGSTGIQAPPAGSVAPGEVGNSSPKAGTVSVPVSSETQRPSGATTEQDWRPTGPSAPRGGSHGSNDHDQEPPNTAARPRGASHQASSAARYQHPPHPEVEPDAEEKGSIQPHAAPDLATIALLAPWVEKGQRQVGRQALHKVVNLYADLGGLSPRVQKAMDHLLALSDGAEDGSGKPSLRQCLRLLADLDALLQRARRDATGAALLAAYLCNGSEDDTT
ncbi:MAG: hypothetical protein NZ951_02890 [Dehalococcoidia bacterium]|nr:hypothetical protein [Dehalococcoidia bacterium]MDW8120121.1 hypothetical protein [Chloroflexota bacterium]